MVNVSCEFSDGECLACAGHAMSNHKVIFEVLVAVVERGQVFFTKFF